jgi:hypothetical protein
MVKPGGGADLTQEALRSEDGGWLAVDSLALQSKAHQGTGTSQVAAVKICGARAEGDPGFAYSSPLTAHAFDDAG